MTPKQLFVLQLLRRYFYLRVAQIVRALIKKGFLKKDEKNAVTRGVMRQLEKLGYVQRYEPVMKDDVTGGLPPTFVITIKGAAALAREMKDVNLTLTVQPNFKDWMSLNHYCKLSSLHMTIDEAFGSQDYVRLHALRFEHEVVRPEAEGGDRFLLRTKVGVNAEGKPVYSCADTAMEVEVEGYRRALVTEYETASSDTRHVIYKKHKGHQGLATKHLYRRFFPEARDMRVLCFCPYESWMNSLRDELRKLREKIGDKAGAEFWFFCDTTKVTQATFLHGDIFYTADEGPFPLVPAPSPLALTPKGGREERREEKREERR